MRSSSPHTLAKAKEEGAAEEQENAKWLNTTARLNCIRGILWNISLDDFNPWQMFNVHWPTANNLLLIFFIWYHSLSDSRSNIRIGWGCLLLPISVSLSLFLPPSHSLSTSRSPTINIIFWLIMDLYALSHKILCVRIAENEKCMNKMNRMRKPFNGDECTAHALAINHTDFTINMSIRLIINNSQ